jgi:hypothetical protein
MFCFANCVTSCLQHVLLSTVDLLVCHMFCFANRVSSSLQHVLFCQPCNFLFTTFFVLSPWIFLFVICVALPTVYLLVYNMFCFANRVTSYLQHVLFCQRLSSCLQHVLFCQPWIFLFVICFALPTCVF